MLKRRVMPRLRPRQLAQNYGARQRYLATPPPPSAHLEQFRASVQRFLREGSPITAVRGAIAKRRIFNLDLEVDSVDASCTRL